MIDNIFRSMTGVHMRFYKFLYVGEQVKHVHLIKQKLRVHAYVNIYLITLSSGDDQLEIYQAALLKQRYFRKHAPIVIGIAADHAEAVGLVERIVQESLQRTGACDLKAYLKLRVKDQKKGI